MMIKKAVLQDPYIRMGICTVLEGIARHGVTVTQRRPDRFLVVWNLTIACNFRREHCYHQSLSGGSDELDLEEKLGLIHQLDEAGVSSVALSSGETTISPHFDRVLQDLSSRSIYTSVATDGWTFSDLERLRSAIRICLRYIEFSGDSSDPKKHDRSGESRCPRRWQSRPNPTQWR